MALNIDIEKKDPQGLERMTADEKPFSKKNYYMMGGCLALIVLGFILMSGAVARWRMALTPRSSARAASSWVRHSRSSASCSWHSR